MIKYKFVLVTWNEATKLLLESKNSDSHIKMVSWPINGDFKFGFYVEDK